MIEIKKMVYMEDYACIKTNLQEFVKERKSVTVMYRVRRYQPTFTEMVELMEAIKRDFPEITERNVICTAFERGETHFNDNFIILKFDIQSKFISRIEQELDYL